MMRVGSEHAGVRGGALLLVVAMLSACFFLAMAPAGLSYEYYSNYGNGSFAGEVASVSVSPSKPLVMEDATITVAARNLQNQQNDYVLRTFVSKDGQVLEENDFTFSLNAMKGTSMTLMFSPTKIGTYSVVAKLFDKYKTVLYSEKVLDVDVSSEIGPFDVQLDVLSRTIRPGYEIPLLLTMKNTGTSGTDVQVAISMDCAGQGRIYKDFSVFLEGLGMLGKSLSIPACSEEGYHEITAKIVMFNGVLAQSTSSVFINSTQRNVYLRAPQYVEIVKNSSKVFDVYIRNDDAKAISNVRAIINGIPPEWLRIDPASVNTIEPNQSAIFIVNVSVPADAGSAEYPFTISLGGDETLSQTESVLNVIEAAGGGTQAAGQEAPAYSASFALQAAAALVLAGAIAVVAWWFVEMRPSKSRRIILMKVKDMIRADE